jgi:hypothetical protein
LHQSPDNRNTLLLTIRTTADGSIQLIANAKPLAQFFDFLLGMKRFQLPFDLKVFPNGLSGKNADPGRPCINLFFLVAAKSSCEHWLIFRLIKSNCPGIIFSAGHNKMHERSLPLPDGCNNLDVLSFLKHQILSQISEDLFCCPENKQE